MTTTTVLCGLVIAVGLVGVVVPGLPGTLLVVAAVAVWAYQLGTTTGWVVLGLAVVFVLVGWAVKYAVPGRRLQRAGVPTRTLLAGALLGVVGFFVIPVVGVVVGFVAGVYAAELSRLHRHDLAWPATVSALKAVGLSVLIELVAALLAAVAWGVGVVVA